MNEIDIRPLHKAQAGPVRIWTAVVVLSLLFALSMADRVVGSILVGPIKADLHLSDSAFAMTQGLAIAIFYVLFAVPFGWAADRFDRRYILILGVIIWSFASAGCGLVTAFAPFFVARSLVGAGEAALGPAGYPLIASIAPKRRLALAIMIFSIGGVSGNGLGQIFAGLGFAWFSDLSAQGHFGGWAPWRLVFMATGLPGLVLAAMILFAPRPADASARREEGAASVGGIGAFVGAHWRFYLYHNLGIGLQQAAMLGLVIWNAAFMERNFGWTPQQVGGRFGIVLLLTTVSGVLFHGSFMSRLLARGWKDAHFTWQSAMSLLALPFFFIGYIPHSPALTIVSFGAIAFLLAGASVAGPTALQLATPSPFRGRLSGMYVMVVAVMGTGLGPAVIGLATDFLLKDETKVGLAILSCCVTFSLGAAISLFLGKRFARALIG